MPMPCFGYTKNEDKGVHEMDSYECLVCGYVYDPAKGDEENGIAPETAFEDLPEDWLCPICQQGKEVFEKI